MSPVILFGVVAINLALLACTAGMVAVYRHRRASLWGFRRRENDVEIPAGLGAFMRIVYAGWLIAYAIGVIMAARR